MDELVNSYTLLYQQVSASNCVCDYIGLDPIWKFGNGLGLSKFPQPVVYWFGNQTVEPHLGRSYGFQRLCGSSLSESLDSGRVTLSKALIKLWEGSAPHTRDGLNPLTCSPTQPIQPFKQQLSSGGHLSEQFDQLMLLEDEENPTFVTDTVALFVDECQKKIEKLGEMIGVAEPNFKQIDEVVHQFKGSCASVGVGRLVTICVEMRHR